MRQAHRRSAPVDVYNIETDTSNYFVDSILVHNCHAIQSRNALATRTMRTIASDRRIGLSGTWHGNNFSGAYAPVDWVWPGLLSPSYYSWLDEWAEVKMQCPKCFADVESDDEQCGRCYLTFTRKKRPISSVVGEKNPGAFVKSLPCYFRAEPFPQPPPALEVVVDITPDQRAQYEDLEAQAVTWVRDHDGIEVPIVADLPIVQRQRLRTAALGELALDGEGEIFFADDCKSAKLVALRGVLDEFDRAAGRKEKAVIFTDSKRFARVTARRMQAAGYRTVLWTGDVGETARERLKADFVEDRADYIVASIASLSEGVDGLQRVCSKVVWLSRSENALLNQQSLRRIWRIGVDQAAFAQVDIIARRTLDDGTLRRLEATQTRNRAQMGLTA
ncbi:hypothetical protein [Microbacterium sp. No. 7]|uniref:hypothetical protein n=1 Tax=Microbacterium sp. No. 7 TaxID=1714373 RepID=UPI003FA5517D